MDIVSFSNNIKNTIVEQIDRFSNSSTIEINYTNYSFINKFKKKTLDERLKINKYLLNKYNNSLPIIIDCNPEIKLKKNKYIVLKDLNIGQLMFTIKKQVIMNSTQSIFLLCNNRMLNNTDLIHVIYNKYHEDDGFLYIILTLENVFGRNLKIM